MKAIEDGEPLPDLPSPPPLCDDEATLVSPPERASMSPSILSSRPSLAKLSVNPSLHLIKSTNTLNRSTSSRSSPLQALTEFESLNDQFKESNGYSQGLKKSASNSDLWPAGKHASRDSGLGIEDDTPPPSASTAGASNNARNSQGYGRVVSGKEASSTSSSKMSPRLLSPPTPIPNMMIVDAEELFEMPMSRRSSGSNVADAGSESKEDNGSVKAMKERVGVSVDDDSDSDGPPSDYKSWE